MPDGNICVELAQAIRQLNAQITTFRKLHPHSGTPPELQDLIDELADAEEGFRTKCGPPPQLSFLPKSLDFGIVLPGTVGPSLIVDPSIPPPAISFAGGIEIDRAPADATVRARIKGDTAHFQIRDTIVIDTVIDDAGNVAREVVARTENGDPIQVGQRQLLLVRVQYAALNTEGSFRGMCEIRSDAWEPIDVPLSISVGSITTDFPSPLVLKQGQDNVVLVIVHSTVAQDTTLTYRISPTQLHTGIAILVDPSTVHAHRDTALDLSFVVDADAPLGTQDVFIDQFTPQPTSQLVQVRVEPGDVLVGIDAGTLQLRPGRHSGFIVAVVAQGGAVDVLFEPETVPVGFNLPPLVVQTPANSRRETLMEFVVDDLAPKATFSPVVIKWTANDGQHSGQLFTHVSIV